MTTSTDFPHQNAELETMLTSLVDQVADELGVTVEDLVVAADEIHQRAEFLADVVAAMKQSCACCGRPTAPVAALPRGEWERLYDAAYEYLTVAVFFSGDPAHEFEELFSDETTATAATQLVAEGSTFTAELGMVLDAATRFEDGGISLDEFCLLGIGMAIGCAHAEG